MNRVKATLTFLAFVGLAVGCTDSATDRQLSTAPKTPADLSRVETLERLARSTDGGVSELTAGASVVIVPAGSIDALPAAIAAAGPGGTVILKSGVHTEGDGTTITQPVNLIGEPGAVLVVDTQSDVADVVLDPALHVRNTSNVVIWGLEIRPVGTIGGVAILVERSPRLLIGNNRIFDHQNAVILHFSDQTVIFKNRIVVSGAWLTGDVVEADGIIAANGIGVRIVGNDVANGVFGVFASGRAGLLSANTLHENLFGVILCKVPAGAFQLPSGETFGSVESANLWNAHDNRALNNLATGYLVIDGANNNTLTRNAAAGNAAYDFDLVGESTRFGFCTPPCLQNTVRATGRFANVSIKDCGLNNTIIGGNLVDTTIDPCDAPCPPAAPGSLASPAGARALAVTALKDRIVGGAR